MVDRERAIALRGQGMTHKQIAVQLGCSETWCRHNLREVIVGVMTPLDGVTVKMKAIAILEEALKKIREIE